MKKKISYPESANVAEVLLKYKTKVKASERPKVMSSMDAVKVLRDVWSDQIEYREEMLLLLLNRQHKVLGWYMIGQGGTAGTYCDAKLIFQAALLSHASAIILAHNHPSGNLTPSETDIELTKKIKQGGKLLEVELLDHIILTAESYYSLADEGRM